jgi:D-alanine transaminase
VEKRAFTVKEALAADEAFISSAGTMTQAVIAIDGHTVGTGVPGPVTTQLRELYKSRVMEEAGIKGSG